MYNINQPLNGVGNYHDGYWFPKDFQVHGRVDKGQYYELIWPDGKPVKDHYTIAEKELDYKKRYDEFFKKPYAAEVLELYRFWALQIPITKYKGMALQANTYKKYITPLINDLEKKHQKTVFVTKKREAQTLKRVQAEEKLAINQKKQFNKKLIKYSLISVGSLAIIGIGSYLILKE